MDKIQLYTTIATCSISFSFGTFGNIISIFIFRNKQFKKQPMTVYLIVACLMNILTIFYLPVMMVSTAWGDVTSFICKLLGILMLIIPEFQANL